MGASEKENENKMPVTRNKEDVSEATISKLLNDFESAALLKRSLDSNLDPNAPTEKVGFEEISSSLKHLHLKKPANVRQKIRDRKGPSRKGSSSNKYNLSVAAVSVQRPVVWPGKLNNSSKKDDVGVIQPSRLSLGKKENEPSPLSSLGSNVNITSVDEKTRIESELKKQNIHQFGSLSESAQKYASFSNLSQRHSLNDAQAEANSPTLKLTTSSVKRPNSCSIPVAKHRRLYNEMYVSSDIAQCLDYRCTSSSEDYACGNSFVSPSKRSNNSTGKNVTSERNQTSCVQDEGLLTSLSPRPDNLTSTGSNGENASCSEEVGMDESNVNELASYFDNMLYIPKKMSVMAEMMYA